MSIISIPTYQELLKFESLLTSEEKSERRNKLKREMSERFKSTPIKEVKKRRTFVEYLEKEEAEKKAATLRRKEFDDQQTPEEKELAKDFFREIMRSSGIVKRTNVKPHPSYVEFLEEQTNETHNEKELRKNKFFELVREMKAINESNLLRQTEQVDQKRRLLRERGF
jgi:hypothetical protein